MKTTKHLSLSPLRGFGGLLIAMAVALASCNETNSDCFTVRAAHVAANATYKLMRDSCLNIFLPECMEIGGYKGQYDDCLEYDSLMAAHCVLEWILAVNFFAGLNQKEWEAVSGVGRTAEKALDLRDKMAAIIDANKRCFDE